MGPTRICSFLRGFISFGVVAIAFPHLTAAAPTAASDSPVPLLQAHAHNDYEHQRPLEDALAHGFCSIEADVHLVGGQLLVGHDRESLQPGRTLATLYLDPLRARVKQNGGWVYREGASIVLLVDVKSDAVATYAALDVVLAQYAEILTTFRAGKIESGPITVIVSGERALAVMAKQPVRYAAVDGRLADLADHPSPDLVPLVSMNWETVFAWKWHGLMPTETRQQLVRYVSELHASHRQVRFWNTPDHADAWKELAGAGVDLIGTDDLGGLQRFFRDRARP